MATNTSFIEAAIKSDLYMAGISEFSTNDQKPIERMANLFVAIITRDIAEETIKSVANDLSIDEMEILSSLYGMEFLVEDGKVTDAVLNR